MSSYILQAADTRILLPNSYFMFHWGYTGAYDSLPTVYSQIEFCKKYDDILMDIYIEKAKEGSKFKNWSQSKIKDQIYDQMKYVPGVYDFIVANSKASGGKWGVVASRVELWVNRYRYVVGLAQALACVDKKMEFARVKPTKEPCRSCLGLEGRVYRNSVWLANDCIPPSRNTDCRGLFCGHTLLPTDKRITPGPFPRRLLRQ